MESTKRTRAARLMDKLAIESEPGLSNAQLMLTNHDLKPGQFDRTLELTPSRPPY